MLIPESWLRSYCNPPLDTDQLAHALTMAGLEVESVPGRGTCVRLAIAIPAAEPREA